MSEELSWVLDRAREHTVALVADVPSHDIRLQSIPGERHPAWILGHLLLSDTYLLSLLGLRPLGEGFKTHPTNARCPAGTGPADHRTSSA
jgi:hypothetical protein